MVKLLSWLWSKLHARRKWQVALVGILMLMGGLFEAVSLSVVVPFLSVLAAPEKILVYPLITSFLGSLQFFLAEFGLAGRFASGSQALVFLLAVFFGVAALVAGTVRLLLLWMSARLANSVGSDLSLEIYRKTLYQPYCAHVLQNSSTVISDMTAKVEDVTKVLTSVLTIGASSVLTFFLVGTLFAIHAPLALTAVFVLGAGYFLITKICKKKIHQNSLRIAREQAQVIKAIQEGLGGIRDVLLDGTQPAYCEIYQTSDKPLRLARAQNSFMAQSPRFIMESAGMVLFAILAWIMSCGSHGVLTALPVLGALVLGAQRLLPAFQQAYAGWSTISGAQVSTEDVMKILDQPLRIEVFKSLPKPLPFNESICFESIGFRYSSSTPWVVRQLSFVIRKGSRVGFVGKTGSGKSTCLDLLMGLLRPEEGQILVDGQELDDNNIRAWQRNLAHVPQSVYLADSSLAENIAFGVPLHQIDMERVRIAAQQAQIDDFALSSPHGFETRVGERGVRLSGGQRQRIGIARALYKQAQVLIFDEATSALDQKTEEKVMNSLRNLDRNLTILIIAHRISTLSGCAKVIDLETQKSLEHLKNQTSSNN